MQHRTEIFAKMNGRANGGGEHGAFDEDEVRAEILNPFVHKIEMDNLVDKIKTAVFTVVLLPFRVIVITAVLVAAWFLACIGLHGLSEETLLTKPMTGWRSSLRRFVCRMVRAMFVVSGWHGVRVIGEQRRAPPRVAPVLCVAPHSSFFDAIALVWLGAPSVVAKADTARLPFFGRT